MYSEYNMYVDNIISYYLQIVKINKDKLLVTNISISKCKYRIVIIGK